MLKNIVKPPLKYLYLQIKRNLVRLGYYSRPSFLIIGAQKAGTSALFSMLGQHPQIVAPARKEMGFFYKAETQYDDVLTYHTMFPLPYHLGSGKLTFEATPDYLHRPECAQRIREYAPDMRLIAILREPVARAYSAWNMFRGFVNSSSSFCRELAESRTFEDAIAEELKFIEQAGCFYSPHNFPYHYVGRGIYSEQLQNYFRYFPRDAILILNHSDLLRAPEASLAQICKFLEIDDTFTFTIERKNVSNYKSNIPKATAEILRDFYAPHNQRLFELLGREFTW